MEDCANGAQERDLAPTDRGAERRLELYAESAYPEIAASARVRVVEMAHHARQLGLHTQFLPAMTDSEYRQMSGEGDVGAQCRAVVRSAVRLARREAPPAGAVTLVHRLRSLLPGFGERAMPDIYDFDDALYVDAPFAHHSTLSRLKAEAQRCVRYIGSARCVFAGNEVLADFAMSRANRVEVIPSCVDPTVQPTRVHADGDCLVLGWIGSATTASYVESLLPVLERLNGRGVSVRLVAMGAGPGVDGRWSQSRAWSPQAERELLAAVDVGLMPLPDTPWTRGKCGYKLLRYFAAGLPTIGTGVGVNRRLLAAGGGVCASSDRDWERAIEGFLRDAAERRQVGEVARRFVEAEYSFQAWAPRVVELIRELAR